MGVHAFNLCWSLDGWSFKVYSNFYLNTEPLDTSSFEMIYYICYKEYDSLYRMQKVK